MALSMRRILLVLSVTAVMALMLATMSVPAFAGPPASANPGGCGVGHGYVNPEDPHYGVAYYAKQDRGLVNTTGGNPSEDIKEYHEGQC